MRFRIASDVYNEILSYPGLVVNPRSPLPLGGCVKLEILGGELHLVGISGSMSVHFHTDQVQNTEDGVAVVDLEMLKADVSSMRDTVTAHTDRTNLIMVAGKSRRKRRLVPSDDFPIEPKKGGKDIIIKGSEFMSGISAVKFAMVSDGSRPELAGVRIKSGYFYAGDGQRAALIKLGFNQEMTIPCGSIDAIGAICSGHDKIECNIGKWIFFTTSRCTLGVSCSGTQYLDAVKIVIDQCLGLQPTAIFKVRREPLLRILSSLMVYTDRARVYGIEYAKLLVDGYPKLMTDIPDIGLFEDELPISNMSGKMDYELLFSPLQLYQDVSQLSEEEFELKVFGALQPILVSDRKDYYIVQTVMGTRSSVKGGTNDDADDDF